MKISNPGEPTQPELAKPKLLSKVKEEKAMKKSSSNRKNNSKGFQKPKEPNHSEVSTASTQPPKQRKPGLPKVPLKKKIEVPKPP